MSRVLIAGGYGVVGHQAARLLAERQPELELLIGGRHPEKATTLVNQLPRAQAVRLDMSDADPLATLDRLPDLVLVMANDGDDRLLHSALRHGVALIDITRWTTRVHDALAWAAAVPPRMPLVFASAWMASVPATLAVDAACGFATLARIDLDILYAMHDRAGPNSVEYMDRLATPFDAFINGRRVQRTPFSATRRVIFAGNQRCTTALFETPDQMTLPGITRAGTVTAHIGFDDEVSNRLMLGMIRSGLWRLISGSAFAGLRRKLLYNPGEGDHHRVRITLEGRDNNGQPLCRTIDLDDPAGQTHLTATGAVVQVERVLGLSSHASAPPGVQFAEALTDADRLREMLDSVGVRLQIAEQSV